jgi:hypothetical protein
LSLAPAASAQTRLRRLSLDLTGLPPGAAEVRAFAADPSAGKWAVEAERLLASPHFGEKWARHWLDQARYADSDGYEKDWVRPWAWRYRDWVIGSLNRNLPFDRFSIEQLAGDLLAEGGDDARVATGFLRMTLTNREGGVDNEQFRFENMIDRANSIGAVWLGLTVGCAQCHDHKYDPLPQRDYYRLAAFFENLEETDIPVPLRGERGAWLRGERAYRQESETLLRRYRVAELQSGWEADLLAAAANPGRRTDWDLAWDCLLKLTQGGDGERIIRKKPASRTAYERDVLSGHFIRNYHFAVGQGRYREAGFPELDRQLAGLKERYARPSLAYTVTEAAQRRASHLRLRGDYQALGPGVEAGTPAVLPPLGASGPASRLDLARWLVSRGNPLTARVVVNRIWQELFGQGLVKSSEDFGAQGDRPDHPELLDWLAAELLDSGWNFKHIIRLVVTSETYQQSSAIRPALLERDPDNRWLARQRRLRLPAEAIRDAALAVAGLLDPRLSGPSVRPPQPAGVAELAYANSVKWTESQGADRYRRGLYIHFQRTTPYPLLANFDAPRGNVPVCRRNRSNTPLQALNLLNDPAFVEAAQAFAARILREGGAAPEGRLKFAFAAALGRPPGAAEAARLLAFLVEQQRILAAERAVSPPDAAWVMLASVLLNLDEFITRE